MTSTELAVRAPHPVALTTDQLQYIANTEFVPPGLRGNLPAILACVATGREIGIGDMVALKSIHIIDGKATYSAELMVMLARRAGHSITGTVTEGAANVTGRRGDNGDEMTVEWTLAMAERAGLLGKSNWKKYPEAMLWARAASQLCRELFADCFAGATYTPEELGADETDSAGEPMAESDSATGPTVATESPVSQAAVSPAEPASPAVYDPAEDIPFGDAAEPYQPPAPTAKAKKKADVTVTKLREAGKLRVDALYGAIAATRGWKADELERVVTGRKADGQLSWARLRDNLTGPELSGLLDHLAPMLAAHEQTLALLEYSEANGNRETVEEAIARHRAGYGDADHYEWLARQHARIAGAEAA